MPASGLSRKEFITSLVLGAAAAALPQGQQPQTPTQEIGLDEVRAFEKIAGLELTEAERQSVLASVRAFRRGYEAVRAQPITFAVEPSTVFTPLGGGSLPGSRVQSALPRPERIDPKRLSPEDIAFLPVSQMAHLVRDRRLSPVLLAEIYLDRLKRHGEPLLNVVTLTEPLAMEQARRAEREIAAGRWRGPLHGIPYGIKDLFATRGIPTTWGSEPHKEQTFDFDATVVRKLEEAGAVLLAKLSMGALAQGDLWFKGRTRNPWNIEQGSSGSSAGSASATAAGLVAFSIGTETFGSIISPSLRCRVTGHRPTYGRVSRYGGMALSYTLDKVGPICRTVEDCALVLAQILGSDPMDPSAVDRAFTWRPKLDLRRLQIGFLATDEEVSEPKRLQSDPVVAHLSKLGATVRPVRFTAMPAGVSVILGVEASSAFDEFMRSERIDLLKDSNWPLTFRSNRFVPAVEYLQAQRARSLVMRKFEVELGDLDVVVARGNGGVLLGLTNYCGHPQTLVPYGGDGSGYSFVGRLYRDDVSMEVARQVQEALGFHLLRPRL